MKVLWVFAAVGLLGCDRQPTKDAVRVAVIGGMVTSGMWERVASEFERCTGWHVEVVATGPKEVIGPAFRAGGIDLLTMHSSDVATDLVADGYARNLRPWVRNELVLLAPPDDPAGVVGGSDGALALRRIHDAGCKFIDARGSGKRLIAEKLWKKAGLDPAGDWVIRDTSGSAQDLLAFAARERAYVLVGRIPVLTGKMPAAGMKVAVRGDPDMQRPYVVIEADPKRVQGTNAEGARALSDFLTGPQGQALLTQLASERADGIPLFFPIQSP